MENYLHMLFEETQSERNRFNLRSMFFLILSILYDILQAYCKEEGATAVAVETKSENEFLKQMLRSLEEPGTETG